MASELVVAVEVISVLAAINLLYSTLKACRSSGVMYLLGIPAGFGLLALGYFVKALGSAALNLPATGLLFGVVSLLILTYGFLFLALTYARRTRLRLFGESGWMELAVPSAITIASIAYVITFESSATPDVVPKSLDVGLTVVLAIAALYVVYETARNWSFTKRASEGFVTVGYALLFVANIGFILASQKWTNFDIALFVGYEGRLLGLFVLNAVTIVGIKRNDFGALSRRLGLTAPAHRKYALVQHSP